MHAYADRDLADERKADETDSQFFYKTRKKVWGPYKEQVWDLPAELRTVLGQALESKFEFLIRQLKANDTREITLRYVTHKPVEVQPPTIVGKS